MADDTNKRKLFLKNTAVSIVVCYMSMIDMQETVMHNTKSIFT